MSRPSATQSPLFMSSLCRSTSAALTSGSVATRDAASDTSGVRSAGSWKSISTSRARSAAVPFGSRRRESPTALYIAPESRYVKPSCVATAFATVLFPAPAGPSIAITMAARLPGQQTREIALERRVRHRDRLEALHLDALLGDQARDGAQHRQAVVAARVDRPAA